MEPKPEAATLPSAAVCPPHLFNMPPVEFTMNDYLQLKEDDEGWTSPPFYTHPQGYNGEGTHVEACACLMRGEHDDQLHAVAVRR